MRRTTRLPDTEFEIMKIVWENEPPITTGMIMQQIGNERGWRAPTAISLLLRLVERGFLETKKQGKERVYFPSIAQDDYRQYETGNFFQLYHNGSITSFINALYDGSSLNRSDLEQLKLWLSEKGV